MEATKRICKQRRTRKEPIKPEHLSKVYEAIGKNNCSLLDLRTFCSMLWSFAGFLRYSEVSQLKACDIETQERI